MRIVLCLAALAASGCGPGAMIGTWAFDTMVTTENPSGGTDRALRTQRLELKPGTSTELSWKVGRCDIPLEMYKDQAQAKLLQPRCDLKAGDPWFFGTTVGTDSELIVESATFSLYTDEKPPQLVHAFGPGEAGLVANFELRQRNAGSMGSDYDQMISFRTMSNYGYRVQ